jgi:hypothetical protein
MSRLAELLLAMTLLGGLIALTADELREIVPALTAEVAELFDASAQRDQLIAELLDELDQP